MGRNSIVDEIKAWVTSGNPVNVIIFINVCVFLIINLIKVIELLFNAGPDGAIYGPVMEQLLLRDDILNLLTHPWTLFTHMFAHEGILHILFNMLYLYWFGSILQQFTGNKHVWPLYIFGGLAGAFFLMVVYNIFPGLQSRIPYINALGASAAVNAIVLASATLVPDFSIRLLFFGDVRLKWIALIVVVLNFLGLTGSNPIGALGHLGGALFGFIYIKQLRVGNDMSKPFYVVTGFFQRLFTRIVPSKRPRVVYKQQDKSKPKSSRSSSKNNQDKIDAILDKISQSGYDSLTKEEKAFLFQSSKED